MNSWVNKWIAGQVDGGRMHKKRVINERRACVSTLILEEYLTRQRENHGWFEAKINATSLWSEHGVPNIMTSHQRRSDIT